MTEYVGNRNHLAEAIKKVRWSQENSSFNIDRNAHRYVECLQGIGATFDYLRTAKTIKSNRILDIGAGTTSAVDELRRLYPGAADFDFWGITLKYHPDIEQNLGRSKTVIGAIETTKAFEPESIAVCLSVMGLCYSVEPEGAIRNIDRFLCPGGVIKSVHPEYNSRYGRSVAFPTDRFAYELKKIGYDVALLPVNFSILFGSPSSPLLVAIKPGHKVTMSAEELLTADRERLNKDRIITRSGGLGRALPQRLSV